LFDAVDKNGKKVHENLRFIRAFLDKSRVEILAVGAETSDVYADLRSELKRQGRPIPTNDLWIAAQTIENAAVLLSNDVHFEHLIGLRRASF
jgi:tRNA(fMet)-specific endonuclease VapC